MINSILENNKEIQSFKKDISAINERIKDEFLKELHSKCIKPLFEKYLELVSINWYYNDYYNDEYYYFKSSFKVNDLHYYELEDIEHLAKFRGEIPKINTQFYNDVFNKLKEIFIDVLEENDEENYYTRRTEQENKIITHIIYKIFNNNDFNIKFTKDEIEIEEG